MRHCQTLPDGVLHPGVRLAVSDEERDKVFQFRYKVYVEQQGKSIHAADHVRRTMQDDLDDWGFVLYAERDGQVVGTVSAYLGAHGPIPERYACSLFMDKFKDFGPSTWSLASRLMVEKRWRSQLVLPLLQSVYSVGRAFGSRFSFLYCAPHLVPFFQKLGFHQHGDLYEDEEVGLRAPMVLVMEDVEHMERVHSPFVEEARKWGTSRETALWFAERFMVLT